MSQTVKKKKRDKGGGVQKPESEDVVVLQNQNKAPFASLSFLRRENNNKVKAETHRECQVTTVKQTNKKKKKVRKGVKKGGGKKKKRTKEHKSG